MVRPTAEQQKQWNDEGYLVFEKAIQGDDLKRLQDAFDHWSVVCKEDWLNQVEAGESTATFYDIPDPFAKDEIFVDLIDHPSYYGALMTFTDDQLILLGPQVRTVPPWPLSYISWHPDVPFSNPLHIKVQIYVHDVLPESGEFAFVPGSHKLDSGPYPKVKRARSMPGHRTFPGEAGTAIIFNTYGCHTSMDIQTGIARKSIILIYEKSTPNRVSPDRFAAIANYCVTPQRRRLFSLEAYES